MLGALIPPFEGKNLRLYEVSTFDQNIQMLMLHRVDLMLINPVAMAELMKKYPEYSGKVKRIDPAVLEEKLYNLISKKRKDHVAVVNDFNRGLQEIKADGTFDEIVKKHGFIRSEF